ncbi:hypothetical protein NECAME_06558 [Necator americanus]|uniref:Uncharacterized protein n=1 Tax=Necator americanus TaxID=51031 RepID=W2TU46_NECAM|nr:hypothetical protein NECAME_06558 [Necator americanus]ETN85169.1 hypothetical protein NECAME_06558 [Necator americanus]
MMSVDNEPTRGVATERTIIAQTLSCTHSNLIWSRPLRLSSYGVMDHGASIALLIACIVVLVESRYYDIENVADGHLRKHHAHDVKHHMKRAKPIETDYVGIDQHGQAYVNCTYNMDGVVGVRKCSMPASDAAFDMGLACFALWNGEGEIIAQDCWIHQEVSVVKNFIRTISTGTHIMLLPYFVLHESEKNLEKY